eukprot:g16055.t1
MLQRLEQHAEYPVSLFNNCKPAIGLLGFVVGGFVVGALRASFDFISSLPSSSRDVQSEGDKLQPLPWGPLQALSLPKSERYCIFVYGSFELQSKGCKKLARADKQDGWVCGAKLWKDSLAYSTGIPGDVIKGTLLCWPAASFSKKLSLLDQMHGYVSSSPREGYLTRTVADVVCKDRSPVQAYFYLADSGVLQASELVRERLGLDRWPLPLSAFPKGTVLVGGAVRDALLDRVRKDPDLDLVVDDDAIAFCRHLARTFGGSTVVLDAERSMARLVIQGWDFDLAKREGENVYVDLKRRDYTINAIALPLERGTPLIDPTGGVADIQRRQLVAVSEVNLVADPLRLLRGVRLASQLNLTIVPETFGFIGTNSPRLGEVAAERVFQELEKLAGAVNGHVGLAQTIDLGLLRHWGVEGNRSELLHLTFERALSWGLTSEEAEWSVPLVRMAALLNETTLERLKSSRRLQTRCRYLRKWQQRVSQKEGLGNLSEEELFELHKELEADLPAFALHLQLPQAQKELKCWRDPNDELAHPRSPVDGHTLQKQLGLPPGKAMGQLLHYLTFERAFGRIPGGDSTHGALEMAQKWWNIHGSQKRRTAAV